MARQCGGLRRCTRPPSWSIKTRTSSLPTEFLKSAISDLICSGDWQFRANRISPQGRDSAKKRRSESESAAPAHPEMKALKSTARVNARLGPRSRPESDTPQLLGHHQTIRQALRLQLTTELGSGGLVGDRADPEPIPRSLRAEIGLLHHRPVVGQERGIFLLHVGKGRERVGLVLL